MTLRLVVFFVVTIVSTILAFSSVRLVFIGYVEDKLKPALCGVLIGIPTIGWFLFSFWILAQYIVQHTGW